MLLCSYRKALRMMRYADHHGFPIITFIATPEAFADLRSEELGRGEAIAFNLRAMFGVKVPIVTAVIDEGGSGGALAIGCANKLYMLELLCCQVELTKANAVVRKEIERAVDKEGSGWKIEEPKPEMANGSDRQKVEKLGTEMREEITAVIHLMDLKKKRSKKLWDCPCEKQLVCR
ncbi:hypothetical protein GW17_00037429 [Ensete ventricosum]|nr:hypothetical protein GW17_00037429 [Ensete ventricosum]